MAAALFLCCLGPGSRAEPPTADAEFTKESLRWLEPIGAGGTAHVVNPFGDIQLRFGGYGSEVEILAAVQRLNPGARLDVGRSVSESGLEIVVAAEPRDTGDALAVRDRVDLVVYVPRGVRVEAETVDGKIAAKGVESDLVLSSIKGEIHLRAIAGSIQARSQRGKITAILKSAVTREAQTFATETGEIEVHIPEGADAEVHIATSGLISTDFSVEIEHRRHEEPGKHAVAIIGADGALLKLSSKRGDVRLLRMQTDFRIETEAP